MGASAAVGRPGVKYPLETIDMLSEPETYTGAAAAKAREIAKRAETSLKV
jgi:adenylosuccinate lyase